MWIHIGFYVDPDENMDPVCKKLHESKLNDDDF